MIDNRKIESDIKEKLVAINRITKVVKGGRRFGFAALVVVGNQKGSIGIGQGKSKQVPDAIKKATEDAKRNLIKIPLKEGRTLHHDVKGKNGSGKVFLRAAPAGTGIIAGGPIRSVCEVLGIQDVVAKSTGSQNPHNMVNATIVALQGLASPRAVAARRGKKERRAVPCKGDAITTVAMRDVCVSGQASRQSARTDRRTLATGAKKRRYSRSGSNR